jgi:hypothetical protein
VFDYDPQTKEQSAKWRTKIFPRPKKARLRRSRVKTMIFFDSRGIVHKEFVPPRQNGNHAFYKRVLERLQNMSSESERTLRTIACCTTITRLPTLDLNWRISAEETHSHTSTSYLQSRSSSVRFLPLPKLKSKLKGHHFGTMENIQKIEKL